MRVYVVERWDDFYVARYEIAGVYDSLERAKAAVRDDVKRYSDEVGDETILEDFEKDGYVDQFVRIGDYELERGDPSEAYNFRHSLPLKGSNVPAPKKKPPMPLVEPPRKVEPVAPISKVCGVIKG